MRAALAIAVAGVLALAAPGVAARFFGPRISPRASAALHMLALIGIAVVPVALFVCLAGASLAPGCDGPLRGHPHPSQWVALGLAGGLIAWISLVGLSVLRATRRATPRASGWRASALQPGRVPLHVLPLDTPVAYAVGVGRGQVVVSEGLVRILDEEERKAALAHELAHVQARHPRLLFLGRVVVQAFGVIPEVRFAFASLRRELEAIADDEAVRAIGDPAIVASAIAKVGLARTPVPGAALAEETDLGYRIGRLLGRYPVSRPRATAAWFAAGVLGLGIVLAQCGAFHPAPLWVGMAGCSGAVGWLALRPLGPVVA